MKTLVKKVLTAAMLGVLAAGAVVVPGPQQATAHAQQRQPRYGGSASCQIQCSDGKCKFINCSGSGYLSYEDARSGLQSKLEAQVRLEGGQISGSISFSISKEW